ncbi:hypothetical protein Ancab_027844 [Ancistrocladus abbreviatus]
MVDYKKVDWRGYFNSMFWNLNSSDKASTLAGVVENPSRKSPKAIFRVVVLVAEMSSDAFQLPGMNEMGMIPSIFAARLALMLGSSHSGIGFSPLCVHAFVFVQVQIPTIGILCFAIGVIFRSWMTFQEIVEFLNFLYSIAMPLEFAVLIKLRIRQPNLHRPYRVFPKDTWNDNSLPFSIFATRFCHIFCFSENSSSKQCNCCPRVQQKDEKWTKVNNAEQHKIPAQGSDEFNPKEGSDEATASLLLDPSATRTEQEYEILKEILKEE